MSTQCHLNGCVSAVEQKGSDSFDMILLWLVLSAIFLVIELITVGMVSIWFMVGSLSALLAAALNAPLWLQIVLFVVVSALCFLLLYPKLKKFVGHGRQATNADMVIGQTCIVKQKIDNISGTGIVSVSGKNWTARSASGESIEEGSFVRADKIEGVKLIVSPVSQQSTVN